MITKQIKNLGKKRSFENAVKSLNIEPNNIILENKTNLIDLVEIAIKRTKNHPSIQIIKENICLEQEFDFGQVEIEMVSLRISSNRLKEVLEVSALCQTSIVGQEKR